MDFTQHFRRALPRNATNTAFVLMGLMLSLLTAEPVVDMDKREIAAGRLRIAVGPNGLPAQIDIQAAPSDLPLEHRGEKATAPTAETLAAIGRGPQLAAPMLLEASVEGKEIELVATAPAALEQKGEAVLCRADLAGGGVNAKLDISYDSDGAMRFNIGYAGGAVESLALVLRIQGPVDTAVAGVAPFKASDYSLPEGEGLLWGNAAPPNPAPKGPTPPINRGDPGVPAHLFWGNGDRGFTWLSDSADGWTTTPVAATMVLSRDKAGIVTWRALLVNHPTELKAEKTVAFTLLTHPATTPAADRRKVAWLTWPYVGQALTPPLTDSVGRVNNPAYNNAPVRADHATPHETRAKAILLQGPAGGDARSAADTIADTYS
ncbi:MAG: hypothetical protein HY681_07985, partial [Chloroflexi bacterium]|nr:hypothetical protein [Chloroflexota bacterium]